MALGDGSYIFTNVKTSYSFLKNMKFMRLLSCEIINYPITNELIKVMTTIPIKSYFMKESILEKTSNRA